MPNLQIIVDANIASPQNFKESTNVQCLILIAEETFKLLLVFNKGLIF